MEPAQNCPLSVDDTIASIRAQCRPLPAEAVPLEEAHERILREPVVADSDQPPFDRSAMDGYAVRVDDRSESFRIVDRIRAGEWKPRAVNPGETVQVATGGAMPCDGLQVVMKEDVLVEGERIVLQERNVQRYVRFRGEDARAGQTLIEPGTSLNAGALALAASVGCALPSVTRLPGVLHVATGDEIVPPGAKPKRGQIRDSNSTLVRAFLARFRIRPRQLRVGEDRAAIHGAIRDSLPDVELLLVSGGASVGEHDFTRELLEALGYAIHVNRTTTRPGKPMIFGAKTDGVAFGLPGNPLSHFVCLNLYVRQALWRFSGATHPPEFVEGILTDDFAAEANARETLWPSRFELCNGEARLTPLRWQSSGDLTALATANALARIAPNQGPLRRGARLRFLPT